MKYLICFYCIHLNSSALHSTNHDCIQLLVWLIIALRKVIIHISIIHSFFVSFELFILFCIFFLVCNAMLCIHIYFVFREEKNVSNKKRKYFHDSQIIYASVLVKFPTQTKLSLSSTSNATLVQVVTIIVSCTYVHACIHSYTCIGIHIQLRTQRRERVKEKEQ